MKIVPPPFLSAGLRRQPGRTQSPGWAKRFVRSCILSSIFSGIINPLLAIPLLEQRLPMTAAVMAQSVPSTSGTPQQFINEAKFQYSDPSQGESFSGTTNILQLSSDDPLVDPLGRILGCGGAPLSDYNGFSVAIFEPDPSDPTGTELGNLLPLTATELPDIPNNGVFGGIAPNGVNRNPFPLSNAGGGRYNFLFDPNLGQTDVGRTYILLISPPENGNFLERRIKLEITESRDSSLLSYRATSLDGQPISADGGTQITQTVVLVPNAEQIGLNLLSLQLETVLCEPNQISISKTADRATASPGDIVLYRLAVRNQSDVAIDGLSFSDRLPRGLSLLDDAVRAMISNEEISITTSNQGRLAVLTTTATLPPQGVMTVIYAAQVTPDALRGSGRNSAIVDGQRVDNGLSVKDGPAIHDLEIRPGILTDYGLLIGRVFHDKNFDGEQQRDEPGLANAVIFLQDGNRIVTDENGLFSVANVQPGYHSGVLDLSSVPGYDFAPNHYRREFNSDSRLVRLEPSGMARMNFPVTPVQSTVEPALERPTKPDRMNSRPSQGSTENFLLRPQEVQ